MPLSLSPPLLLILVFGSHTTLQCYMQNSILHITLQCGVTVFSSADGDNVHGEWSLAGHDVLLCSSDHPVPDAAIDLSERD